MIDRSILTRFAGAVRAAVEVVPHLNAVTDDPAVAVLTNRREHVDRAFEGIESVGLAVEDDVKGAFVGISAVVAGFHGSFP
jgi:hypothetical protein